MSAPPIDPQFEQLLDYVRTARSVDFSGYKRNSLMRLVSRRMLATGHTSYAEYQDHLQVDPAEFVDLLDVLFINVTSFARDPDCWSALRDTYLPALLAERPAPTPLRVWSAACATGEEAFTAAILLAELLGPDEFRDRVKIYATDVDEPALSHARLGRYPRAALEPLDRFDPKAVDRYFDEDGDQLVVRPELRGAVIFGRHDVIADAPISRIDLLLCRNLLMYLNSETQTRVLDRFHFALRDTGVLVLGRAEMLLTYGDRLVPIDMSQRLFRKNGLRAPAPTAVRPASSSGALSRVTQAAFAGAPEAQIVTDLAGNLRLVNDSAVRRLGISRADVERPLRDLPVSSSPVELRGPIALATAENRVVQVSDVGARAPDGANIWYDVQVAPLSVDGVEVLGVQITYTDITRYRRLTDDLEVASRELATAYEELQSSNEELETTNEELQSAVEELETTNEELQSTNEELETMNEELQSTNEELQTVNEELRVRTGEVNQVNAYLESILTGLRGGVIVVDRDLIVRVWNERAEKMWGLRAHEAHGQHFFNLDVGLPVDQLREGLRGVAHGDRPELEMTIPGTNRLGRSVLCKVRCSQLRDASARVTGAIIIMEELLSVDPVG